MVGWQGDRTVRAFGHHGVCPSVGVFDPGHPVLEADVAAQVGQVESSMRGCAM